MPSERVQRRIDRLLDQAEEAADGRDWSAVAESVRMVLKLDPENEDARAFEAMVDESDSGASVATATSLDPTSGAESGAASIERAPERVLPDSFVDGRYQVSGFLGEGGRKQVYLAHDTRLDRDVAFAVIKTDGLEALGRERIQREAQALGRLGGHPHIVTIFDVGEDDGAPYIVSEYMPGGDLEATLSAAPERHLDLDQVRRFGAEAAQGLAGAHGNGIIHRDLKPGNIWISQDGTAKLGDFAWPSPVPRRG